jgi:hemerythrin-like domain-containing protein
MNFLNRISQTLHEEHAATVALMERLENLLARHRGGEPPPAGDPAASRLLSDLAAALTAEIARHFEFEEDHIFTLLDEMGDPAIGAHLTEEHVAIRPIGARVAELARQAGVAGFDQAGWDEFRRLGLQLCQRLFAHVQKEEMALLPLVEEHMDTATEARLVRDYVEHV